MLFLNNYDTQAWGSNPGTRHFDANVNEELQNEQQSYVFICINISSAF